MGKKTSQPQFRFNSAIYALINAQNETQNTQTTFEDILNPNEKVKAKLSKQDLGGIKSTLKEVYGITKIEDFKPYETLLVASQNDHFGLATVIINTHGTTLSFKQKFNVLAASNSTGHFYRHMLQHSMDIASRDNNARLFNSIFFTTILGYLLISIMPIYSLMVNVGFIISVGTLNLIPIVKSHYDLGQTRLLGAFSKILPPRKPKPNKDFPDFTKGLNLIADVTQELEVIQLGKAAGESWTSYFKSYAIPKSYLPGHWPLFTAAKQCQMENADTLDNIINHLEKVKQAKIDREKKHKH